MSGLLTVLAGQIAVPAMASTTDREHHLDRVAAQLDEALGQAPADLVVLPELSSLDYSRATFERLNEFAEPLDGPSYACLRGIAQKYRVPIVYGIARRDAGAFHISQVVIGAAGEIIGHYDKLHMAQYGASCEKEYFARGDHLLVFELGGLRIAPIICYDIRIPELTRTLALRHKVDLLLHCGAYARDESFQSWHAFVVARAMENQIYVLSLNRAGTDFGDSIFCPPWVDETTPAERFPQSDEAWRVLRIDPAEIRSVRERYSFLADRLPDYEALA